MKMNIEIELDFINEDMTLEDTFQEEVKRSIMQRVEREMISSYKPLIDKAFNESVNKTIENILNDYMNKPVTISNGYKTENYESALDMIEKKFTSLYDEKFRNKQGCTKDPILEKITNDITGKTTRLLDEMGTKLKREGDKIAKEAIKNSGLSEAIENIIGKK